MSFLQIALSSQRVAWCSKFSVNFETGETQCVKSPHPVGNDEIVMPPDSPRENERSVLEQTLNPRAVDANGYG